MYACNSLYLIDSPVVKGENLKFKLAEVREVVKAVLLPWYNAFRFATQNYRVLVKVCLSCSGHTAADVWCVWLQRSGKPFVANFSVRPTNVMDRWILALQQSLISFVRAEMAGMLWFIPLLNGDLFDVHCSVPLGHCCA